MMMNAPTFQMRPLTWTLLALLAVLLFVAFAPALDQAQSGLVQWLGILLALPVLITGMVFIRAMNRRLAQLAAVAEAIGEGDYNSRAEDSRDDAIGLLARAINRMAGEIQQAVVRLETQQTELEENRRQLQAQHARLSLEYERQSSFGDYLSSLNTVDINTLATRGLEAIMRAADAQLGQIYGRDSSGKLIKLVERGIDRVALGALVRERPEDGLPGELLARRQPISIDGLDAQSFPMVNLGFAAVRLKSVLGLPILFQEQALGAVVIGALAAPDKSTLQRVQNINDALGSALNNAMTYKTVQQQALKLEQANQELLEADRLRSEFVANMSHELRTPLNSIIGFSGVLMKNRQQTLSSKDLEHVEKINRNGKHLLSLINDILDLSKIEAGRMDVDIRATNIVALVRDTVDMLHTQAEARGLSLQLESADSLPDIRTDGDKLRQVLINLIGNALKFTHHGGVKVNLRRSGDNSLILDVIDTGIGIPEDKIETIFEPFRQADSGTTRQYGGTGLGLTITRSLVEMLGGRISVDSVPGEGSMFSVQLPLNQDALPPVVLAEPPILPAPLPARDQALLKSAKTVLIVDDDADARSLLARYVEDMGAKVISAADSGEVLPLARQYRPDLITLDLMMPGTDGWEILRRLKAEPELRDIPVVIISILAERRRALVLGAMDALSKPIAQDDLIAILRRTLRDTRNGRVLVVDDNSEVQELFKNLLDSELQEIRTAANGREALAVLNDYQPDLIFLDLMMPEMDGLTFLRILRTDKQLMHIPVVVVTAKQLSAAERRELEMRVVQIIQKGDDTLEERLKDVLANALRSAA